MYIYIYMHMYMYICKYTYTYTSVHKRIHMYTHMYIHTYIGIYVHTYILTYIHTRTYVDTYILMHASGISGVSQARRNRRQRCDFLKGRPSVGGHRRCAAYATSRTARTTPDSSVRSLTPRLQEPLYLPIVWSRTPKKVIVPYKSHLKMMLLIN